MSGLRLGLAFALTALAAAIVFLPMRLALAWGGAEAMGLAARRVEGSVWSGVLRDASFRGTPLGTMKAGLDPLGLVTGALRLRFASDGVLSGAGAVALGRERLNLGGADLEVPMHVVFADLPLRGRLRLADADIAFRNGRCARADGRLTIDRLGLGARGPEIPGLSLAGALACREGALVVPLSGEAPGVSFAGSIRIDGAGAYRIDSRVQAADPTIEAAFGLSGFGRSADGFARVDQGRLGAPQPRPSGP